MPEEVLHRHFNEMQKRTALTLYGRNMYELMKYWDAPPVESAPYEQELARAWQGTPKVVFSTTLESVGPNARLVRNSSKPCRLRAQRPSTVALNTGRFMGDGIVGARSGVTVKRKTRCAVTKSSSPSRHNDPADFEDIDSSLHGWNPAWGTAGGAAPALPVRVAPEPAFPYMAEVPLPYAPATPWESGEESHHRKFTDVDSRETWSLCF